jgi:hypothetical protein
LSEKDGTHRTLVKMKCLEILTVPICVIETKSALDSLTDMDIVDVLVVNKKTQLMNDIINSSYINDPRSICRIWFEFRQVEV